MKKIALTIATIALAMGATAAQAAPAAKTYKCNKQFNVAVKPAGKDKIRIRVSGPSTHNVLLKLTPAGSGELYSNPKGIYGNETEFHIKGKDANFSFVDTSGNDMSLVCRSK